MHRTLIHIITTTAYFENTETVRELRRDLEIITSPVTTIQIELSISGYVIFVYPGYFRSFSVELVDFLKEL